MSAQLLLELSPHLGREPLELRHSAPSAVRQRGRLVEQREAVLERLTLSGQFAARKWAHWRITCGYRCAYTRLAPLASFDGLSAPFPRYRIDHARPSGTPGEVVGGHAQGVRRSLEELRVAAAPAAHEHDFCQEDW
ncbi:MAG: hypothetical protein ACKVPX_05375 [Myxococcaceae bacterium]